MPAIGRRESGSRRCLGHQSPAAATFLCLHHATHRPRAPDRRAGRACRAAHQPTRPARRAFCSGVRAFFPARRVICSAARAFFSARRANNSDRRAFCSARRAGEPDPPSFFPGLPRKFLGPRSYFLGRRSYFPGPPSTCTRRAEQKARPVRLFSRWVHGAVAGAGVASKPGSASGSARSVWRVPDT